MSFRCCRRMVLFVLAHLLVTSIVLLDDVSHPTFSPRITHIVVAAVSSSGSSEGTSSSSAFLPPQVPRHRRSLLQKHKAHLDLQPIAGGNQEFCFLSMGCWGGLNRKTQNQVAHLMARLADQYNISFLLVAGDNFYKKGVTSVHDSRFYDTFEAVYKEGTRLPSAPWFLTMGNHDYRGNIDAQYHYSVLHLEGEEERRIEQEEVNSDKAARVKRARERSTGRWYMPYGYYAHAIGGNLLLLVVLDCPLLERCHVNPAGSPRCLDKDQQVPWITSILERYGQQFRFRVMMCHYPVFSNGPHINHPWLIKIVQPLCDRHNVQLYVNADNHYLQLSQVNKTFFLNSGGGGGYLQHTKQDKKYKTSPYNVWDHISNGAAVHCIQKSAAGGGAVDTVAAGGGGERSLNTKIFSVSSKEQQSPMYTFSVPGTKPTRGQERVVLLPVGGGETKEQDTHMKREEGKEEQQSISENNNVLAATTAKVGEDEKKNTRGNTLQQQRPSFAPDSDDILVHGILLCAVLLLVLLLMLRGRSTGRPVGSTGSRLGRRGHQRGISSEGGGAEPNFPSSLVLGTYNSSGSGGVTAAGSSGAPVVGGSSTTVSVNVSHATHLSKEV